MADKDNMQNMLNELSHRLGVSENQLKNAAQNGNVQDVLKKTDKKQAKKVEEILNDPDKTRELLSSPQAQALLKLFGGDKNV